MNEEKVEYAVTKVQAPFAQIMPANFEQMMIQADVLVKSGLLPAEIKTAAAAATIMLTGREYGMTTMQSFRFLCVVKGKISMYAQCMAALILNAGHCYHVDEMTDERCTITFTRKGGKPKAYTFTMGDAKRADLSGGINYQKYPAQMLWARCMAKGARAEMPDVIGGMYTPDELSSGAVLEPMGDVVDVKPTITIITSEQPAEAQATPQPALTAQQIAARRNEFTIPDWFKPDDKSLAAARAVSVTFGKHAGTTLGDIDDADHSYIAWLTESYEPKSPDGEKVKRAATYLRAYRKSREQAYHMPESLLDDDPQEQAA
jgi:hypothetical protein